jgi:hypothetical protein
VLFKHTLAYNRLYTSHPLIWNEILPLGRIFCPRYRSYIAYQSGSVEYDMNCLRTLEVAESGFDPTRSTDFSVRSFCVVLCVGRRFATV